MGSFGGEAVGSSRFPARNAYARSSEAPPRPVVGDPTDPQGMVVLLNRFLDWLRARNKEDRMVPIGQRALSWIGNYTRDARPTLLVNPSETTLFLTADGVPLAKR